MKYKRCPLSLQIAFVLVAGPVYVLGQSDSCHSIGQLYGMDPIGSEFLLMSDAGALTTIPFSDSTQFIQVGAGRQTLPAPIRLNPIQVNVGDRLCVQRSEANAKVLVTRRGDIDTQQREELAAWQAQSAYGLITAIDPVGHSIHIEVSNAGGMRDVKVDASGSANYQFLEGGHFTRDASAWSRWSLGDPFYVRGDVSADATTMKATLTIAGGFRTFTGVVESMSVLEHWVRIRTLLSGTSRTLDVDATALYGVDPQGPIRMIWLPDLQPGNPILVLAQHSAQAGDVQVLAALASFSTFGLEPHGAGPLPWAFETWK